MKEADFAKGPAKESNTLVSLASSLSVSKSLESAISTPGDVLLGLSCLMSLMRAVSFGWERPAMAHFKSVGQFWTTYFAASLPVYPSVSAFLLHLPVAP